MFELVAGSILVGHPGVEYTCTHEHHVCGDECLSSNFRLGPKDAPALWLTPGKQGKNNGAHIAFRAKDRVSVDRFHAAGLQADGRDNGSPGPRPDYGAAYYAAFLIDPDGNSVEAVCLAKE